MGLTLRDKSIFSLAFAVSLLIHGFALAYINLKNLTYPQTPGPSLRVKLVQQKPQTKTAVVATKKTSAVKRKPPIKKQKPKPAINPKATISKPTVVPKPMQTVQSTPAKKEVPIQDKTEPETPQPAVPPPLAIPIEPAVTIAQRKPATIPTYANNPKPAYPIAAKRRGMAGVVLLEVTVNTAGTVSQVRIKKSSGYVILDKAAFKAVAAWKFVPASEDGEDIESLVEIPLRFELAQDS